MPPFLPEHGVLAALELMDVVRKKAKMAIFNMGRCQSVFVGWVKRVYLPTVRWLYIQLVAGRATIA